MADEKSNVNGEKKEEKVAIWGAIIQGVVSIVGSIFDNKSKNDAMKNQAKQAKAANDAALAEQGQANAAIFADYVKNQDARFIELGRKLKKTAMGGPALTSSEMAEYTQLKAVDVSKRSGAESKMTVTNAITNPNTPPVTKDGGLSFGGSNLDPFGLGEILIKPEGSTKTAGMSPLLLIGLLSGGAFMLYRANRPKGKRRR